MPHTDSLTIYAEVIPPYYLLVVWVWIYWLLLMIWKVGSQWCSPLPVTLRVPTFTMLCFLGKRIQGLHIYSGNPQFYVSEMGAGSCMGGDLVRLLSQKAPVDFDWRTSVWLGMVLDPKLIFWSNGLKFDTTLVHQGDQFCTRLSDSAVLILWLVVTSTKGWYSMKMFNLLIFKTATWIKQVL